MRSLAPAIAASLLLLIASHPASAQTPRQDTIISVEERGFPQLRGEYSPTPTIRPAMLAAYVDVFAGQTVRVPFARVVGVFEPNVFLIDSKSELYPIAGNRARVLVLIEHGALRVPPAKLVGSTVTVLGVARTLLGVQITGETPWPPALTPERLEKLEIKAAILAKSLMTADGVDLTNRAASGAAPDPSSDRRRKDTATPPRVRAAHRPPS